MFFILDVATCDDVALAGFLTIVKTLLTLLQIFGPILCIISLVLIFIKGEFNPDDKKLTKSIVNRVLALLIMFFVPVIVNATMGLIGENTNFSSCWNNASDVVKASDRYIDKHDKDKTSPLIDPDKYQNGESKSDGSSESGTSNQTSSGSGEMILIGDSRAVQTYEYLSNDWGNQANYSGGGVHTSDSTVFVAEGGKGINWLKQSGIPAAQGYFTSGKAVVIMLGVNDVSTTNIAQTYANYINSNVDSWTANGSKIYFSAVTPCDGSYASLNSNIDNFNTTLKSLLSNKVGWIDTDVYIKSKGYKTVDGLHYDQDTTLKIYNYIKSKV